MSSVDPPSPPSPSTMSQEDLFRAIQSIDLNMRNMNLILNQWIDQACALFESRASESLPTIGVLGSAPSGSRRLLEPLVPVPVIVPSDVVASHGPAVRVEAPKFLGHDPGGWIYKVQSYFDYFRTPDHIRLRLVGLLFYSPASDWFLYQQNNNLITSWQGLLEAVRQRFDLAYYEDYLVSSQSQKQSHGHQENSGDIAVEKTDSVQSVVVVEERLVKKEQHHQLSSSVVIQSRIDEGHDWKKASAKKASDHKSLKVHIFDQSKGISKPATSLSQATQVELHVSAVGETNASVANLSGTSPEKTLYGQYDTAIATIYVESRTPNCFIKEEDTQVNLDTLTPILKESGAIDDTTSQTESAVVEDMLVKLVNFSPPWAANEMSQLHDLLSVNLETSQGCVQEAVGCVESFDPELDIASTEIKGEDADLEDGFSALELVGNVEEDVDVSVDEEHFSVVASYFAENHDVLIRCSESLQASLRGKPTKVLSLFDEGYGSDSEKFVKAGTNYSLNMAALSDTGTSADYFGAQDPSPKLNDQNGANPSPYGIPIPYNIPANMMLSHANTMYSLQASMQWDDSVFGLDYDLDFFNIVIIPDFNMRAMENKGLTICNSRLFLASSELVSGGDLFAAMRDVNGADFVIFFLWYFQAPTPRVKVTSFYNAEAYTYSRKFGQEEPLNEYKFATHLPVILRRQVYPLLVLEDKDTLNGGAMTRMNLRQFISTIIS